MSDLYGYNYDSWCKTKECECGCIKAYGKECPIEYHSYWCPLSPNYKKEEYTEDTMYHKRWKNGAD